jgi:hypothetical protein
MVYLELTQFEFALARVFLIELALVIGPRSLLVTQTVSG